MSHQFYIKFWQGRLRFAKIHDPTAGVGIQAAMVRVRWRQWGMTDVDDAHFLLSVKVFMKSRQFNLVSSSHSVHFYI
jgi:hypothetical protein